MGRGQNSEDCYNAATVGDLGTTMAYWTLVILFARELIQVTKLLCGQLFGKRANVRSVKNLYYPNFKVTTLQEPICLA